MKNLKLKLLATIVTLFILIIGIAILTPFGGYVLAYINDYNKAVGDTLTADMWNNLDDDFGVNVVKKTCGTAGDAYSAQGATYGDCTCDSGEAIGGGCNLNGAAPASTMNSSMPFNNDTWRCETTSGSLENVYVFCL